ncbi:MAG: TIGR02452 family protein [Oscillospiraceae bacterium]
MSLQAMQIALETVEFIKNGGYLNNHFSNDISKAILYSPQSLKNLSVELKKEGSDAKVSIYNEDTCECAKRFISDGYTCILNFASAMNIGGGFLRGCTAQEETICRNSTLYASINSGDAREYYTFNNENISRYPMYSDYAIFSPHVEVFRDGKGNLLDIPYTISAITSPAVNVFKAHCCTKDMVYNCMLNRAEYIFKIAISNNVDNLVLGAWGCGVFGNNPYDVAKIFKYLLLDKGYIKSFKNVSFAIYDRYCNNFDAFNEILNNII